MEQYNDLFLIQSAKRWVGYSQKNKSVDFEGTLYSLEGTQYLSSLEHIRFEGYVTDGRPLENMTSLKSIDVVETPLDSLNFLASMDSLEVVELTVNAVTNEHSSTIIDDTLHVFTDYPY